MFIVGSSVQRLAALTGQDPLAMSAGLIGGRLGQPFGYGSPPQAGRPGTRSGAAAGGAAAPARPAVERKQRVILSGFVAYYDGTSATESFNQRTRIVERVMPGAFDTSLRQPWDITCLVSHDPAMRLGSVATNTLLVWATARGLTWRCDMPPDWASVKIENLVNRKVFKGSSFGWLDGDAKWREYSDFDNRTYMQNVTVRELVACKLADVGPALSPCCAGTSVSVRRE